MAMLANHIATVAQEQTNLAAHSETMASQDNLMAMLAALPAEGHNVPDEILISSLVDKPAKQGGKISSLLQGVSDAKPAVTFTNRYLSGGSEHAALPASAREISAAVESARGFNHVVRETSPSTSNSLPGRGNSQAGPLLTDIPAITTAARSGGNAGRDGGVPLAVLDNTGNEPRPGQATERGNGHNAQFKEQAGDGAITRHSSGQTITIRQFNQTEDVLASPPPGNRPVIEAHSSPQDTKAHYIHSNLPNKVLQSDRDSKNGQQNKDTNNQHKESDPFRPVQQGKLNLHPTSSFLTMTSGENEPLLFSHNPMTTPPATTGTQTEMAMFRLPSGLMVPEGTVIEQLITHFSANRRLESGSISLQLHPRELGALRMEIKVEQDNIKAHITVQNPQAQEMIDRHLPRLREALEQQGLFLQQVEVTLAAEDNTNGRRFQNNHPQQQQAGRFPRNSFNPSTSALETESAGDYPAGTTGNISVHV